MEYVAFYTILCLLIPLAMKYSYRKDKIILNGPIIRFSKLRITKILVFCITIYVFFRAFAYDTGTDFLNYYSHYYMQGKGGYWEWGDNREVGYKFLVDVSSSICGNPALFFGVAATVCMVSLIAISSMYGKASYYITLLWPVYLLILSQNLYRQYFSMHFLLFSFYFFEKREKIWKVILFLVLAVMFHTSALIALILIVSVYLVRNKRISKWFLIGSTIVSAILANIILKEFLVNLNFMSQLYESQTGKSYNVEGILDSLYNTSSMIIPITISNIIYIWYGDKKMRTNKHLQFLFYLMSFTLILTSLMKQEILMRICLYLRAFMPVSVGVMLYLNFKTGLKKENIILLIALLFNLSYYIYYLYNLGIEFPLQFKF